jgi:hypothetical protein
MLDQQPSSLGREPTTENFLEDFGPSSPIFRFASSAWLEAIAAVRRQADFQAPYANWRKSLSIAYGTSVGDKVLFVRHSYLATLAKLIVHLLITGAQMPPDVAQTHAILQGRFFEEKQIVGFHGEDSFAWVARAPVLACTHKIASRFAELLFTYRLKELSEDVLKELYQALVDPKDRHGLGEYYTPDWLAARMCDALLSRTGMDVVLDPACGSGAFLYQAIQHKKRCLPANRESLGRILSSVVGMDIHPLAVLVSKVNVLLALGDLLDLRSGPVSIPVYLANSIRPESSTKAFSPLGEKVDRPGVVSSRGGPDEGVRSLPAASANNTRHPTPFLNHFDVVIGNPPWVSFRFIEKGEYQDYLKKLIVKECGLLEGSAHLVTHLELATLFFARCANLYLKPSGRIGFVLPRSIFTADQHDRFRRSCGMGNTTLTRIWDLEGVSPLFSVPAAVAFGDLSGRANQTLPGEILRGRLKRRNASWEEAGRDLKTEATEFHVVQQGRRSFLGSRSRPSGARASCPQRACNSGAKGGQDARAPSFYHAHFREGATIVPRSFWFVEFKSAPTPRALTESSHLAVATDPRARVEAKPPYKLVRFEADVEAEFIYATLLSTDLLPFGHLDFRPVVLPLIEDGQGYRLLNAEQARGKGHLRLAEWLDRVQTVWAAIRKEKAAKANALAWLNYRNKLTEQNPEAKYVVLYTRSATFLCAAALRVARTCFPRSAALLSGQEIVRQHFVAADSTYYFETEDPKEAGFLAALLNSPRIDSLIKPMQARGLWGPRDIHKKVWELPIPQFNSGDKRHLRLAELAEDSAQKVKRMVPGLNKSFEGVRGPRVIGRVRTAVREALNEALAEIDGIVKHILN